MWLYFFGRLFDMFNSSSVHNRKKHKKAYSGTDFQVSFLKTAKCSLENMTINDKFGVNKNETFSYIKG